MQRANLVGKVIRLFTNVQPIESIYISPEAHESWPAVPALRLLPCLFGLRQTVIWCASNTLPYNLPCQMVQSINNPLWPMALVHGVSKVVNEKILSAGEKMPGFCFLCASFALDYNYTCTKGVVLFPECSFQVLRKWRYPSWHYWSLCVWKWDDPNACTAWRTPSDD